jgi:hypothetical protein
MDSNGDASGIRVPDYDLLARIGRGAYGEVWLARNLTESLVAVKIVRRAAFDHDRPYEREFEGIKRFEPISRSHSSQLAILHVGRGENFFYYVMELADQALNPKPETRDPKEIRNSNAESQTVNPSVRTSELGLLSDLGSRISDFYSPHTLRWDLEQHGRLPVADCIRIGLS